MIMAIHYDKILYQPGSISNTTVINRTDDSFIERNDLQKLLYKLRDEINLFYSPKVAVPNVRINKIV